MTSHVFTTHNIHKNNSQADCDNDGDCGPGLICFQRRGVEPVPGCSGEDNIELDGEDICVLKCDAEYCVLHDVGNDLGPDMYGKCEVSNC